LSFAGGPFFASAAILLVWGVAKVRSPRPAAAALGAVGLPLPIGIIRVAACAEVALGTLALVRPEPLVAAMVALAYACFTVVSALFLWSPRVRSCGCLGDRDVPPSVVHVALNAGATLAAVAVAATGALPLPSFVADLGWARGAAFLLGVAAIVYLAYAVVTLFPEAFAAYRGVHHHSRHGDQTGGGRMQRTEDALRSAGVGEGHPSLWGGARPEAAG
jgi:Methylamine utilisation protein MauE